MRTTLRVVTPPSVEPVTVEEAKLHLRVDHIGDAALDNEVTAIIRRAREALEQDTRRAVSVQAADLWLSEWPWKPVIRVPLPPLNAITFITYRKTDGTTSTLSTDSYLVETAVEPGEVWLQNHCEWPEDVQQAGFPIRVRFEAGWAPADVPPSLRAALLLRIEQLYRHRGAVTFGNSQAAAETRPLALGYDSLIAPYRVWNF